MRKLVCVAALLVAVFACGAVSAAPAVDATATAVPSAPAPKLKCQLKKKDIKLKGTQVVATGGCTLGTKPVDKRKLKWTWVTTAADLSGAPCSSFGTGKGNGTSVPLPKRPASVAGPWKGGLPGRYSVKFKLSTKVGKQTKSASATWFKTTPSSYVYCGAPPKLEFGPSAEPQPCRWDPDAEPTLTGRIVKAGTVLCEGHGSCRWQPAQPLMNGHFLVIGQRFVCDNGTDGTVRFTFHYYKDDAWACGNEVKGTSSFVVFTEEWGPGAMIVLAEVVTWIGGGAKGSAIGAPFTVYLKGNEPPCSRN